jgi:hypothetical protein
VDVSLGGPLFLLHVVSCALMTGLIWVVQLLHYPAFRLIPGEHFVRFHSHHSRQITYLVGPWMLIEAVTGILLLKVSGSFTFFAVNLFLLSLTWMSTFFLSVPLHSQLAQGSNAGVILRLVKTNWPRTFLWSLRLVLLLIYSMT